MNIEEILNKLSSQERELISSLIEKDPLTGVYNRRKLFDDLKIFISISDRYKKGCGLLIIDIDNFKQINDQSGHLAGDKILEKVARSVESIIRPYDKSHIYRYGGDEFVVIMPCTSLLDTLKIGERMRIKIKMSCGVSVSIGVSHDNSLTGSIQELLAHADKALNEAKKYGRDKVSTLFNREKIPPECQL
jgi:diguanylate cyclase (GGDEF)-like protein